MNPTRLALYGGTFDPVHHGHLLLARDALEQLQLDHVVFLPARLSPHKLATAPAPAALRREMLAAALAGEAGFVLDDAELEHDGPSFTIDSVERIRAAHPGAKLYYLVGADNLRELHTWRRYEDLCELVEFVVFGRHHETPSPLATDGGPPESGRRKSANPSIEAFRTLTRRVDISATEIRQRVARGQSIRYLVPESVRSLIATHHLYQDSSHQI